MSAALGQQLEQLAGGQLTVTGGGVVEQDDVAALLAADGVAVLPHILEDVAVAYGGLFGVDALRLHILDEAEVGHDRNDSGVAVQTALVLHRHRQQGDDLVAVKLLPLLVAGEAAVGVAVKGDAAVKAALDDSLFQIVQMGAAHTGVDVLAVIRSFRKNSLLLFFLV